MDAKRYSVQMASKVAGVSPTSLRCAGGTVDREIALDESSYRSTIVPGNVMLAPVLLDEIYTGEGSMMGINRGFNHLRIFHQIRTGDHLRLKTKFTYSEPLEEDCRNGFWNLDYSGLGCEKPIRITNSINRYYPTPCD